MNELEKQIESLQKHAAELAEVKEDIFNLKVDFSMNAIGVLVTKLSDTIEELLEGVSKKDYYDKDLSGVIKTTLSEIAKTFSEIKAPTVNISPNISLDLKPLETIAEEIANQNKNIIALLGATGKDDDGIFEKQLLQLVENNNKFIEKVQQADYTKVLQEISNNLRKEQTVKLSSLKIQRDPVGRAETLIPVYK